jgi:3-deoxy-7-phosphoheptulonate synthase
MNLLRAFSTGGYAGLERVVEWNLDFMANTPEGNKYMEVAKRVDESIQFMKVRPGAVKAKRNEGFHGLVWM